jgi:hypothetical protein
VSNTAIVDASALKKSVYFETCPYLGLNMFFKTMQ